MTTPGRTAHSLALAGLSALLAAGCAASSPAAAAPEPERVAVGYGTQAPERVTGAVGSLSERDIGRARVARIEQLLQGRLAGV
jgi:hypothetical protein